MKQKFFKKFFLTTTFIVLASFLFIIVFMGFFVGNYLVDEKRSALKENCVAVVNAAGEMQTDDIKVEENERFFKLLSKVTEADIFLADKNGNVFLCSCEDWHIDGSCIHNQNAVSEKIMQAVISGEYSEVGDLDGLFSKVQYSYAMPLYDKSGELQGAVFSSLATTNVRKLFNAIFKLFLLSALIPVIILFFAEYFISYKFTRPLNLMAEAARSMAKGDFSKRILVTGDDEIGELSVAFNQMTNSLVQLEGTRRRFIANVSHELKTPMTTISGFIDGINDGTIPPEKQSYYLSVVSDEIKRLSRLVQSMLSLAKLESGEQQINKSKFDICDMICRIVVSQEQRIAEKNITIEGLDTVEPTTVNADYDLIYQVIYNLVDNAIKFTDVSGKISFYFAGYNNAVEFKIRNTGEGINEKDLPYVFERFYKSDKSRSAVKDSTGLGLYLANTIISIHGGKISVKSKVNDFTEFRFVLPQDK